ncbi:MAG: HNH endonuclease [Gammaproteobacteria bacterium]|nr:HNH endonuclease [Gammaproteobacteria bacterium]
MKSPRWNTELLAEYRAYLRTEDARQAFDALLAAGERQRRYDCVPQRQGESRLLAFDDARSGERAFTCAVNHSDLLLIVRRPGQVRITGGLRNLKERFGWAHDNPTGEWAVRLRTGEEARQLGRMLFGDEPQRRAAPRVAMTPGLWWVNHRQNFRQEYAGRYLWSPKCNRSGSVNESYANMARVRRGDTVLSCVAGELRAVGIVLAGARAAVRPADHGLVESDGSGESGWRVPVRLQLLDEPLRIKEHAAALAAVLPARYSPIRASGDGNPGVYLAQLTAPMAMLLAELLGGQLGRIRAALAQPPAAEWAEAATVVDVEQRRDLAPSAREQLLRARRGQGVFRRNVEQHEHGCRITRVLDRRHLCAVHIKPWHACDEREMLDGCNGLLLAPHVQHLFERGYISFADDGELLVSQRLNPSVLAAWGVMLPLNAGPFRPEQQTYLAAHRRTVFECHDGGRRALGPSPAVPGSSDP